MSRYRSEWRISDHVRRRCGSAAGRGPEVSSQLMENAPPPAGPLRLGPGPDAHFRSRFPKEVLRCRAGRGASNVLAAGDEILAGRWELLGTLRQTWRTRIGFSIPVTGTAGPSVRLLLQGQSPI